MDKVVCLDGGVGGGAFRNGVRRVLADTLNRPLGNQESKITFLPLKGPIKSIVKARQNTETPQSSPELPYVFRKQQDILSSRPFDSRVYTYSLPTRHEGSQRYQLSPDDLVRWTRSHSGYSDYDRNHEG